MTTGRLPVPTAELIGTFLEAIFYGIYLAILPQCIQILRKKRTNDWLTAYFLVTMILSFILITMHLCVDLTRAMAAFTNAMSEEDAPEKYFANVDTALNIMKTASYVTVTMIADAVILFRTWVVWGRNYWIVAVPALLFAADIAFSGWFTWSINEAKQGDSVLISNAFARSKYFYAVTLSLNITCTVLIAYRVWRIQRSVSSHALGRLPNAVSIIMESGKYREFDPFHRVVDDSVTESAAMFFWLNSISPVIGSVFSYVILRSSSNSSTYNTSNHTSGGGGAPGIGVQLASRSGRIDIDSALKTPPGRICDGVEIHLEQIVHVDDENPNESYTYRTESPTTSAPDDEEKGTAL
ncbi:hypothetical protein K474DRAFT_1672033 [Panus rudis PR-1116 ss-1]|nr:hypothetical protein K474DRAFT_1672033 [Panus rudis PR-1116 ss-1]